MIKSGGSTLKISGFNDTSDVHLSLSGGSRINGDWSCGDIISTLSGGSTATLNGTGKHLSADLSGGSQLNIQKFTVNNINADLSGGSRLYYANGASLGKIDLSGGSSTSVE